MSGFIVGADRNQSTLFPETLDDYVAEESATRVIDVFVDEIDLSGLGFKIEPADTGRPGYHPHEPCSIEPSIRAGSTAERGVDVADGPIVAGVQNHCCFQEGQW